MTVHRGVIAAQRGVPLEEARAALLMLHGRGDSAEGIVGLADLLAAPGVACVAPQATGNTWYPYSFMSPLEANEPWLGSALDAVHEALVTLSGAGVPQERIVLLGFSQGACLACEFAARHGGRFGGVAVLSGGLIGPDGTPRDYGTDLEGTPVLLGCSDVDGHIPVRRVHESARVLTDLGAVVEERIYPGMGHTVNRDELDFVQEMLQRIVGPHP